MARKSEPKRHVGVVDGTLCNHNSWCARMRTADCVACQKRLDALLELLLDAADGHDVTGRAAALARKLGIERADAPAESSPAGAEALP